MRQAFDSALARIRRFYGEEYINTVIIDTDMMRTDEKYRFTPKQFLDWLLEADIHAIVGHMHQV